MALAFAAPPNLLSKSVINSLKLKSASGSDCAIGAHVLHTLSTHSLNGATIILVEIPLEKRYGKNGCHAIYLKDFLFPSGKLKVDLEPLIVDSILNFFSSIKFGKLLFPNNSV